MVKSDLNKQLEKTYYLDYDSVIVQDFISENTNQEQSINEKAISLYYAVRDKIKYNPYLVSGEKNTFKASFVISQKQGYCVTKAITYATVLRGIGVPAKVGFANVKNHLSNSKLAKIMKTDIFAFHGYTEVYMFDHWVKATPAFHKVVCRAFGVAPLDFDGKEDSIFHPQTKKGDKFMEYIVDHGSFDDFPFGKMVDEYQVYYPHFFDDSNNILDMQTEIDFQPDK